MNTDHEYRDAILPPPGELHNRIMAAVRAAPPPARRRTGRVIAIGGGALATAAALLLAMPAWMGEGVGDPAPADEVSVADAIEVDRPVRSLWEISTAEVTAFANAVDGASGEATRTALSLFDQAGSGLRIFSNVEVQYEEDEDIRSDSGAGAADSPAT